MRAQRPQWSLLDRIDGGKRVYMTGTTLRDRFAIRIFVLSFRTLTDRMRRDSKTSARCCTKSDSRCLGRFFFKRNERKNSRIHAALCCRTLWPSRFHQFSFFKVGGRSMKRILLATVFLALASTGLAQTDDGDMVID